MTTINNSENLIEKVGGIEKAREIVKWQSESSWADYYCISENTIGSAGRKFSEELCLKNNDFVLIDDLRTAIAEHDELLGNSEEFNVGDLVVIKANPFWPEDYFIQQVEPENIGKWYMNAWRHATPEEIKAGHRIDDTTDHVTDIRNHVSPSTKVIEHDEQIKCWSCNKHMTENQRSANDGFCIHCGNEVDL